MIAWLIGCAVEIRLATTQDLDALLPIQREVQELHVQAHPERYRKSTDAELRAGMESFLGQEDTTVWVATDGRALPGFAIVQVEDLPGNPYRLPMRVLHLDQRSVLERTHRQGIGHALMTTIRDFAQQAHCATIRLDVLEFNQNAKAFYVKEGFEPFRQRRVMRLDQP